MFARSSHGCARVVFAVAVCIVAAARPAAAQPGPVYPSGRVTLPVLRDGSHDFDFLVGAWSFEMGLLLQPFTGPNVATRRSRGRLTARAVDTTTITLAWESTPDSGNMSGHAEMTYARSRNEWTIRDADSRNGPLSPPMTGAFQNNTGLFVGLREISRRTVLARFDWRVEALDHAVASRSFSFDGGATWELQWILYLWRDGTAATPRPYSQASCCPYLEATWYTVPQGKGSELEALFASESRALGDSQPVQDVALFRSLDRSDAYVLLRGYWTHDMAAFFKGPEWKRHRETLERTRTHADSVYELRYIPYMTTNGIAVGDRLDAKDSASGGVVVATVYRLAPFGGGAGYPFTTYFAQLVAPRIVAHGGRFLTVMASEPFGLDNWTGREMASTVPGRPPAHERTVYVSLVWFPDTAGYERHIAALYADLYSQGTVVPGYMKWLIGEPTVWRLAPVGRSRRLLDWREGLGLRR